MNKLKQLLNTSLLSNKHKQYLSKEEEKENKKDAVLKIKDDDIYVKGVGGYDGTNAGQPGVKTLQEVIESISEIDPQNPKINIHSASFEEKPILEACELLGIRLDDLSQIPDQLFLKVDNRYILTRVYYVKNNDRICVVFGSVDPYMGMTISFDIKDTTASVYLNEIY